MRKRTIAFILSNVLLIGLLSGCSAFSKIIEQYSSGKEECSLNTDNVTQFTYKKKNYTILEDTIAKDDLGNWVGFIRKIVVLDADGRVLLQREAGESFKSLADIADTQPDAAYMISFLNVYACKDATSQELSVDTDGEYHKAILSDSATVSDEVFHYDRQQAIAPGGHFSVNSQDCTQLIGQNQVYQITDEIVPQDQLGKYLDIIAKSIVFDRDTKLAITKKNLEKIDLDGKESSTQKRENWFYGEVHEIQGTDTTDSVAVQINSEYRIATCGNISKSR